MATSTWAPSHCPGAMRMAVPHASLAEAGPAALGWGNAGEVGSRVRGNVFRDPCHRCCVPTVRWTETLGTHHTAQAFVHVSECFKCLSLPMPLPLHQRHSRTAMPASYDTRVTRLPLIPLLCSLRPSSKATAVSSATSKPPECGPVSTLRDHQWDSSKARGAWSLRGSVARGHKQLLSVPVIP